MGKQSLQGAVLEGRNPEETEKCFIRLHLLVTKNRFQNALSFLKLGSWGFGERVQRGQVVMEKKHHTNILIN